MRGLSLKAIVVVFAAITLAAFTTEQPVTIHLDSDGTVLRGSIQLVSPVIDPASGTIKVTVEIDDYPAGIRAGDFDDRAEELTALREQARRTAEQALGEADVEGEVDPEVGSDVAGIVVAAAAEQLRRLSRARGGGRRRHPPGPHGQPSFRRL